MSCCFDGLAVTRGRFREAGTLRSGIRDGLLTRCNVKLSEINSFLSTLYGVSAREMGSALEIPQAPLLASLSAISLPSTLEWPGTQNRVTGFVIDICDRFVVIILESAAHHLGTTRPRPTAIAVRLSIKIYSGSSSSSGVVLRIWDKCLSAAASAVWFVPVPSSKEWCVGGWECL